jgi:hypothetical protein
VKYLTGIDVHFLKIQFNFYEVNLIADKLYVEYDFLAAVVMKITISRDITPCTPLGLVQ